MPIFESAVYGLATLRWNQAEQELTVALKAEQRKGGGGGADDERDLGRALPLYTAGMGQREKGGGEGAASASGKALPSASGGKGGAADVPEPPQSTLAFPALAQTVNIYLASLNHLRQCAPLTLRPR